MSVTAIPYRKNFSQAGEALVMSGFDFSTLGFSAAGTFTAGGLSVYGNLDGQTNELVALYKDQAPVSDDEAATAGTYRCNIAGYTQVIIEASDDFSGDVQVVAAPSPAVFIPPVAA